VAEERVERRLAAILCADVAAYSRLMGSDEEGTLAALKSHRRELIDPLIAQHQGRIVKTTGDGMLIEFASVVDAMRCAVVVQQGMEDRNSNVPKGQRIRFRIGINLGDIIIDEGDIFGDGVNVAARLEALAEPGDICVSGAVRDQIGEKLPIGFVDLGEHSVKNIARPVRVHRVDKRAQPHAPAAAYPAAPALSERPSIAVLPFQNMSGEPEQEYFVDGIVEDIITGLSRIKWLFVLARNSTFVYKGRAVDVKQVGRELGARYLLEGSLRKASDRVRMTAQLIETASGTHLWAGRYDRALDDIFEVQDELTLSIVGAIEPSLRQAETERAKRKRPENLDAYDLFMRAQQHSYQSMMPGEADKALELLHQVLAIAPDYPAAHATAAWCYEMRYMRGGMQAADRNAALDHARTAIDLGPDDAASLATAGFVIGLVAHDYTAAMRAIDGALALTGASATALWMGSTVHAHAGDVAKAIEYAERSLRITPFGRDSSFAYGGLAMAYTASGDFAAAVEAAGKAIQANPRFSLLHVLHAAALSRIDRVAEAQAAAARVQECEPDFTISRFVQSHTGRADIWEPIGDALRRLGLPEG
jgi:adenylate cyclase